MAQTFSFGLDDSKGRGKHSILSYGDLDYGKLKHGRKSVLPKSEAKDVLIFTDDTAELYAGRCGGSPIMRITDTPVYESITKFPIPGVEQKLYVAKDTGNVCYWEDDAYHILSTASGSGAGGEITIKPQVYSLPDRASFPTKGTSPAVYVDEATNKIYRFGSDYLYHEIGAAASTSGLESRIKKNESDIAALAKGKADKTELDSKADRADLEKKADKSALDKKADKAALDAKADKSALDAKADKTALASKADISALAEKADKSALDAKADKKALDNKADKADLASKADVAALAGKADKAALDTKADKSELAKYVPVGTKVRMSDLASDVQAAISAKGSSGSSEVTKADLDKKADKMALDSKADKSELAEKADATALELKADKKALAEKADKAELDSKADKKSLELKADKSDLDSKADKSELASKADKSALDTKADKADLDSKADKKDLDGKADKSDLASKADKTALDAKADKKDLDKYRLLATPIAETDLDAALQAKINKASLGSTGTSYDDTAIKNHLSAIEGDYAKLTYSEATYVKKTDKIGIGQIEKDIADALSGIPSLKSQIEDLKKRIETLEKSKSTTTDSTDPSDKPTDPTDDKKLSISSSGAVTLAPVQFGTKFTDLGLPKTVEVTLSDGTKKELNVKWTESTYDATKVGGQNIVGEFELISDIANAKDLKAVAQVNVEDPSKSSWQYDFDITDVASKTITLDSIQKGLRIDGDEMYAKPPIIQILYLGRKPYLKHKDAPIPVPTEVDIEDGEALNTEIANGYVLYNENLAPEHGGSLAFSTGTNGTATYRIVRYADRVKTK